MVKKKDLWCDVTRERLMQVGDDELVPIRVAALLTLKTQSSIESKVVNKKLRCYNFYGEPLVTVNDIKNRVKPPEDGTQLIAVVTWKEIQDKWKGLIK